MTAYDDLMLHEREMQALSQVAGRLGWDQETMMPHGAADQRSEESGAMQAVLHARRTEARRGDLLAAAEAEATDDLARAQLHHIRRDYDRAVRVPGDLAVALARLTSRAQGKWAEARAADDFAAFAPVLAEVVRLKRDEAAAVAQGGDLYDALIDDFEPGMTAARLETLFAEMRPRLVDLRARALDRDWPVLDAQFDTDAQLRLSRELARNFGYDFSRGRIDLAVHPFSSGGGDDVRITTRVSERDPFNCLYSTIHEVGHACYEQGIDPAYRLTPVGQGVSMGVHESQSRIYENQLGRGRAFTGWLFGRMQKTFGAFGIEDADSFHRAVNRVHPGHIRTEADEVQYNLHVMLRFDLEKALIAGDLDAHDLETAWNDRFAADFGYPVDRASNGVLQDVHWSVGLFGYFPTYALGNVYAGCLYRAMRGAVPDLEVSLSRGDLRGATDWLRSQVQCHGGRYTPAEVITRACGGAAPTAGPLLDYLEEKFAAL